MPFLVDAPDLGEPVTLAYPDAENVRVADGALVLLDKDGDALAGFAKWISFRRATTTELDSYEPTED